jgi:hypothetical protein
LLTFYLFCFYSQHAKKRARQRRGAKLDQFDDYEKRLMNVVHDDESPNNDINEDSTSPSAPNLLERLLEDDD